MQSTPGTWSREWHGLCSSMASTCWLWVTRVRSQATRSPSRCRPVRIMPVVWVRVTRALPAHSFTAAVLARQDHAHCAGEGRRHPRHHHAHRRGLRRLVAVGCATAPYARRTYPAAVVLTLLSLGCAPPPRREQRQAL